MTKAARRRNRRIRNNALRVAECKLKVPFNMGLVAAADLAVEERVRPHPPKTIRQAAMARYLARREITQQQYDDGERLWRDYMASGLTATVTGSYGAAAPGSGQPTPGCGPRYAQYRDAMRAVGIMLSSVLAHVVLQGESSRQWALGNKRPMEEGIIALRLALDSLGKHYRG